MNISIFLFLGICTSLLFPPYFIFPLGFIVFPYICFFYEKNFDKINKYKNFFYIFIFYFAFFGNLLIWLKNPFLVFSETENLFYLPIILILLLSLICSFIFTILLSLKNKVPTLFLVPIIFSINEFFVSILVYGFPWITFSLIISNIDFLSFIIKYFGTLVTSYIVIQIFCLPYFLLSIKLKKSTYIFYSIFILFPLFLSFLINFILKNEIKKESIITLEIFQLNQSVELIEQNTEKQLLEIIDLISKSTSDLLVFGENNYPFLIETKSIPRIQNILKNGQSVIIGGTRLIDKKYFNTFMQIENSKIVFFDKKILVPFGEFLPFRKYLNFMQSISGSNDYSKGINKRLINIDNELSYIPIICYEIIFYWNLLNKKNNNADLIINITNDIWFGNFIGPYQHLYLTKLRASEFNKFIIRVSNNGISAIIDQNGKIINFLGLNNKINYKQNIKIVSDKNFYLTHFYLKIYFSIVLILLIIIILIRNYEKTKSKI